MKIRLLTLVLAIVMLAGCFVGCATNTDDPEVTTNATTTIGSGDPNVTTDPNVDAEGYELDDVPELNYGGKKVTALAWSDHTMHEFESTSDVPLADPIQDALLERNNYVQERLGIELAYVWAKGDSSNITTFIQAVDAGAVDGSYDYIAGYSRVAPKLSIEGKLTNMMELEYLNFDKPWWPDALIGECRINDQLYYASGDISTNLLWMMEGMFFNWDLLEKYSIEDNIYDLVNNYKWTVKKFIELSSGRYADTTGDGKTADDEFGYAIYTVNIDDIAVGAGFKCIVNNGDKLVLSGDYESDAIFDLVDTYKDFYNSNDTWSGNTSIRTVFTEQRAIFMNDRLFVIAGKDYSSSPVKIEFEYGLAPLPLNDEKQKEYYTNIGHPFTLYSIPSGISEDRKEMTGAVLECLASKSYRIVTPNVFELVMKVKYNENEDTTKMFDLIRASVVFDVGRMYNVAGYVSSAFSTEIKATGANQWFSNYNKNAEAIKRAVAEINAAYGVTD